MGTGPKCHTRLTSTRFLIVTSIWLRDLSHLKAACHVFPRSPKTNLAPVPGRLSLSTQAFLPCSQNLVRASIAPTLQKAYIKKQVVSTLLDPSSFVRSDLLLTAGLRAGWGRPRLAEASSTSQECDQRRTPRFSQGFYKYQLQETWREQ